MVQPARPVSPASRTPSPSWSSNFVPVMLPVPPETVMVASPTAGSASSLPALSRAVVKKL